MTSLKDTPSPFSFERFAQARILIVDDIPANVKLIEGILTAAGYRNLERAYDGIEALKVTYRINPDLVLLDIMMPNLDGFGYCEQIRSDPGANRMPIIVQTALSEREAKLRAFAGGADDFLNKPLDAEELVMRVHVHLERYFMLQDMDHMRTYLKMELEHAQETIRRMQQGEDVGAAGRNLLNKHYEVLQALSIEPRTE